MTPPPLNTPEVLFWAHIQILKAYKWRRPIRWIGVQLAVAAINWGILTTLLAGGSADDIRVGVSIRAGVAGLWLMKQLHHPSPSAPSILSPALRWINLSTNMQDVCPPLGSELHVEACIHRLTLTPSHGVYQSTAAMRSEGRRGGRKAEMKKWNIMILRN